MGNRIQIFKIVFILICVCFLSGCGGDNNCFEGPGDLSSEIRDIDFFSRLILEDNINIFLINDSVNKVEIVTGKNLIKGIETRVKDDTLVIQNSNFCPWTKGYDYEINLYLHFTDLNWILYKGSGNITSVDTLFFEYLWLGVMNGFGTVTLKLKNHIFRLANSTGTVDYYIEGECDLLYVNDDAYGLVDLSNLRSQKVVFNHKSTNNAFIYAEKQLVGKILYLGDLYYSGNPDSLNVEITGDGKLIRMK